MSELMVVKRNGEIVNFDSSKIQNAIIKAVHATNNKLANEQIINIVRQICDEIEKRFIDFFPNVENIQDIVEKHLVKEGLYEISKAYILYRVKRQEAREIEKEHTFEKLKLGKLRVKSNDGKISLFDINKINNTLKRCSLNLENDISIDLISKELVRNIYDGVTTKDLQKALILSAISFIERDPLYGLVASRVLLRKVFKEITNKKYDADSNGEAYRRSFIKNIKEGVELGIFDKRMLNFDLEILANELKLDRDDLFGYAGLQILYDRYFVRRNGKMFELPQSYWMRVAMGLALNEDNKEERAIEFYNIISQMRYIPSTPTLFHSGLVQPQLSSCFLSTIEDDLHHIFKVIGDNTQLAKWSGGLGNDWSNIRGTGSLIKSTNNESQGVIPFLKVANDANAAINRTGRKRGATCAYLEIWHYDIEDFMDLRKNTGDDRRRTHDMNTATWIPDLFMKRVTEDKDWTLFSPDETPELHHIYGKEFESKYEEYEKIAKNGGIKKHKIIPAQKLWKKLLSSLFETGHPWLTFKDACNIRSPQNHMGVIHSSNLCTEITLNTSKDETAVCNLGSINLSNHINGNEIDNNLLASTIKTAIRMLDNVIDLNYYPTIEAKNSNLKHRPIGLGLMGFQDALFKLRTPFDSEEALKFADNIQELISYYAILSSSKLAKERGAYESYKGSKWDRGLFPIDTIDLLEKERGIPIDISKDSHLDWSPIKEHVKQHGMRNSNTMAIAPTATISNIAGCFPCTEPIYKSIYVKSNMGGEFTIINRYLVKDLKRLKLWNQDMLDQIKYYDGNLQLIATIPNDLKKLYKEAFEIDPEWSLKLTAARSKWIDQSQSHNVFMQGTSGKRLSNIYMTAWKLGLKTTYYLRTLAASQIEKSTLDAVKYGFTQKREYNPLSVNKKNEEKNEKINVPATQVDNVCNLLDPECEACQ